MEKKIIIANLKMNPVSKSDFFDLANSYQLEAKNLSNIELVMAASFIYLDDAIKTGCSIAAQDCFYEDFGPYTGEISPLMLKNLGVKYVIVGHSERRAMGETDEVVSKKIQAVLKNGLIPILCIGENKEEKQAGRIEEVLKTQISKAFHNISLSSSNGPIVIAYEPVWSISTNTIGEIDTPENASKMIELIKKIFGDLKLEIGNFKFIYGGSVNEQNAEDFIKQNNIQGVLVGGASLKKDEFAKILNIANSIK